MATNPPAAAVPAAPAPRAPRGGSSHFARQAGIRPMKEYPLTKDELWTLGLLQGGSSLFLALAGACFGFYLSTAQTLALEKGSTGKEAVINYWSGIGDAAWWAAGVCGLLALVLFGLSGFKVTSIIRSTRHV